LELLVDSTILDENQVRELLKEANELTAILVTRAKAIKHQKDRK
jgi:hypothetical protein